MKALILGGTGAIGQHLVNILSQSNIETFVTSRKSRESFGTVKFIQGNAQEDEFLISLLNQKFDMIVDFMVYSTIDFSKKINLLLQNTNQYVYISSSRVYAKSNVVLTENSPRLLDVCEDKKYLSTEEYALIKARQEDILFNNKRINWTIVRPYITYSNNRLQFGLLEKEGWLYRALYGHKVVFPVDLFEKKTTLTHGYDVARGVFSILGQESALSNAFHITNDISITWSDVWNCYKQTILHLTSKDPEIFLCGIKEFEKAHKGFYQLHYDRMYDRLFSNEKIKKYIDTSGFIHPAEGLNTCLSDFLSNLPIGESLISYGSEGSKDRISKEYWNFSDIRSLKNIFKYTIRRIGL
ncbi:NAD-dependent epimerase/dehydratase family protein [Treponema zuelzerae]|uniref:NAD-dependent epimerase/dehydratase family protein n=1 Tax=Teretinema zuelzerae TaxID=156 RepID=A0AAE3EGN9_9SPIR|nr:NAD-dependent epimerase/dehydratase family protein [Teretinema zuelzerae]MCD1653164.1 NAD-dependent epimerase/dehydratase family protein [Teretinema zuelzerae]